jgi:uncharacterized protein DUF6851/vanadium-dependent haloperoxidase-like protein
MTARAFHLTHAAMYDAWAAHDDLAFGSRLGDVVRRPPAERTEEAKREAVSFAAHRTAVDLFPSEAATFTAVLAGLGYDPDTVGDAGSPSAVGTLAAGEVLAFGHNDGSNQLGDLAPGRYADWTGYRAVNSADALVDPNRWQPLLVDGVPQPFLVPHWGQVVPFGLRDCWELRPQQGPRLHPGRGYQQQAEEVLHDSAGLTDEHKVMAEYWADGPGSETPPGHWCLLAQEVSARDGHGLEEDVRLFFALTGALLDAGIAAWDAKRVYDSVRPVSAIRHLFAGQEVLAWGGPGQGTQRIKGQDWAALRRDPAVRRVRLRPLHLQRRGGRGARPLHRVGRFGVSATMPAGSSRIEPGVTRGPTSPSPGRLSPRRPTRPAAPAATAASISAAVTWSGGSWAVLSAPRPGWPRRPCSRAGQDARQAF